MEGVSPRGVEERSLTFLTNKSVPSVPDCPARNNLTYRGPMKTYRIDIDDVEYDVDTSKTY
jgi:hypothetical protein